MRLRAGMNSESVTSEQRERAELQDEQTTPHSLQLMKIPATQQPPPHSPSRPPAVQASTLIV